MSARVRPTRAGTAEGCKGKIDFLFLLARNGTMITEQQQLLASLPGFIKTIEETFADFDTHLMVANPDGMHMKVHPR